MTPRIVPPVVWIHVPKLSRRTWVGVQGRHPTRPSPTHHAQLVPGFPWWPHSVLASMRCGSPPSIHQQLWPNSAPPRGDVDLLDCGKAPRLVGASPDHFLSRWERPSGPAEPGLDFVAVEEDDAYRGHPVLVEVLDRALERGLRVVVSGDRWRHPRRGSFPLEKLPLHRDLELVHAEGRVAWYRWGTAELPTQWKDEILRERGVERILWERGLELFGAPSQEPASARNYLAVVLDRGVEFGSSSGPETSTAAEEEDPPILLAWGDPRVPPWPQAVHDYRVGPTVLSAVGRTFGAGPAEALPW